MTRKQIEDRMRQLTEELGLELQPEEVEVNGAKLGMGFNIDRQAVEALPVDQQARLEDLRYELAASLNGTEITFSNRRIEPGNVRLSEDKLLDGDDEMVISITCPAMDFQQMLRLAAIGMAMVPMVVQGDATEEQAAQLASWITDCFETPEHFQVAAYKTDELGNLTNRAYMNYRTEADAAALDGVINVEQMFGGC